MNIIEAINSTDYEPRQSGQTVSLFLGRFQPFHIGHETIVKNMSKGNKIPVLVVVKGKESSKDKDRNPLSFDEQRKQVRKLFGSSVLIFEAKTGYIPDIVNDIRKKYKAEVTAVFSGNDRISGYKKQIDSFNSQVEDEKQIQISFNETPRIASATDVRLAIRAGDFDKFKKLMPKKLHQDWDILRKKIK